MQIRQLLIACLMAPIAANANAPVQATKAAFEENKGQIHTTTGDPAPFVYYRLAQGNTVLFLLENGIAYQFNRMHYPDGYEALAMEADNDHQKQLELQQLRKDVRLETYRMDMLLENANPTPRITTEGKSDDYTHYYTHDVLGVHTYTKVTYHDVWPGIDWAIYTTEKGIKYDFIVYPGADPTQVRLRFKHHEELYVDAKGTLIHGNRMGHFTEAKPVSFQSSSAEAMAGGEKRIGTRFVLDGGVLRFDLDAYNPTTTLTIDPARVWGTYYGGTGGEEGRSCAVDGAGNVYLAGWTDTPTSTAIASGGHQVTFGGGNHDAFLVKFNASGARQWGAYYGGSGWDRGWSCAVDGDGNVYLAGETDTPTNTAIASGGHQNTHGGDWDAFLVKFNASGVRQWGTYYGGSGGDYGYSCAVDSDGNVYLAGDTNTPGTVIATGGHQNTYGGSTDAFLVKFNASGARQWGTYYGGTGIDQGWSCAVDGDGNVYLAGDTDTPTGTAIASGGHQDTFGGDWRDTFLVKFNASGARQWGTYYGGTGRDWRGDCAVDGNGNVYLTGWTDTPTGTAIATGGHQNTYGGGTIDAFLVKFNASGMRQWGTYYGGTNSDSGRSCAVDGDGNVYLAGNTGTPTSIASGGHQNTFGGGTNDAFLVKFDASGVRQWGTYYGGTGGESGWSCAVDGDGNVYLAGNTGTPTSTAIATGGHQNTYGGGTDAFLVKFEGGSGTVGLPAYGAAPAMAVWPSPTHGLLTITSATAAPPRHLAVWDATGRLVLSQAIGNTTSPVTVDLSGKESGVYVVEVRFGDGVRVVERVVKE